MQYLDKTIQFQNNISSSQGQVITIFDAGKAPHSIIFSKVGKTVITFAREASNDIVLSSPLVSHHHGRFILSYEKWRIEDVGSTNSLIYNNANITSREISDGDFIRIDDGVETISDGVLFVFSSAESTNKWYKLQTGGLSTITIGRDDNCTITLPHISVSKRHAKIIKENGKYFIIDNNSTNGVVVNNKHISGKVQLHEKDVITITNSKLIFTS